MPTSEKRIKNCSSIEGMSEFFANFTIFSQFLSRAPEFSFLCIFEIEYWSRTALILRSIWPNQGCENRIGSCWSFKRVIRADSVDQSLNLRKNFLHSFLFFYLLISIRSIFQLRLFYYFISPPSRHHFEKSLSYRYGFVTYESEQIADKVIRLEVSIF